MHTDHVRQSRASSRRSTQPIVERKLDHYVDHGHRKGTDRCSRRPFPTALDCARAAQHRATSPDCAGAAAQVLLVTVAPQARVPQPTHQVMSVAKYLTLEEGSLERHEYVDGHFERSC